MSKIKIANSDGTVTNASLDSNGEYRIYEEDDPSAILKQNAYERKHSSGVYRGKGTETSAKKIGSISPVMMLNLIEQGIFWDDKKLMAWFNDLDNYLWRTTEKVRH